MANIVRINGKAVKDLAAAADIATINTEIGNLADLDTTDKSSLVAAINEAAQSGGGGAVDDVKVNGNTVVTNGVANVPLADTINPGVVRIPSGTNASIDIHNGTISVRTATPDAIKYGTNDLPIGANVAKETAFYGLASAAGDTSQKQSVNPVGTYTANAKQAIKTMLGITDVTSYNTLNDKPSINGVTLSGNKTLSNLGAASAADVAAKYTKPSDGIPKSDLASSVQTSLGKADTALQTAPVTSVAGKTGVVTLDAGDVEYDDTDTYAAGTVGADIANLKSEIGDLSNLTTTAKSNLVAAINEAAQSGGGSVGLYYVTPEQYGAVGDGVTDDSQAVQDACDAGYAVYFDSGKTYYLASTVTIDHDCHLFGGEGATIKTKTPTGGVAPNGIVVAGTLKKTTTMTSDYVSAGTGDNSGNQWTLTDMTGIEIGDILIVKATDQYYNYSRAYYYLGATLLIGDIYNGHLYTTDSMPWDITNTANVTVQVYSAPTAIIEGLHFVSDLDSRGNYIYLLTLGHCKNAIVRNCSMTQMDNGLMLNNCVNTLVEGLSLSYSKNDNTLTGDSYGIGIYSSSETIIERVESICAQTCITLSGTTPNINTYIRNCNLASECRANAVGSHENCYNTVVEDCVLTSLNVLGTATVNRCRFIKNNRIIGNSGISFCGSHNPDWAILKVHDCIFDAEDARIGILASSPQSPIQAFNNIVGLVEVVDCVGAMLIYNGTVDSTILSNVIKELRLIRWTDCYEVYHPNTSDIIEKAIVAGCTFQHKLWINDHNDAHGLALTNVYDIDFSSSIPAQHKIYVNKTVYADRYTLPENIAVNLSSNNTSAKFVVCGKNLMPNTPDDLVIGSVSGSDGGTLTRTTATGTIPTITQDSSGNIVYTQPNNTSGYSMYPVGLFIAKETCKVKMSATLKNAGDTTGATFRPYIAIVDCTTGKLESRHNGTPVQATTTGASISYEYPVRANNAILCYYYCNSAVANAVTKFENSIAYIENTFAPSTPESIGTYTAKRRTGDGSILSLDGVNNIMSSETTFDVTFAADYIDNPIGLLPSASGVSF